MAGYIVLWKFTKEGLDRLKEIPDIVKQHKAAMQEERGGIRTIGIWFTMGEYDGVTIYDAPDDQTMVAGILAGLQSGLATTQTMRALSEEEFAQVVSKLP